MLQPRRYNDRGELNAYTRQAYVPCQPCYPIIYQVWFGTDWEDEPHSLDFNFTDNELLQTHLEHEAMMEEEIDILNALMTCKNYMSGKILFCE